MTRDNYRRGAFHGFAAGTVLTFVLAIIAGTIFIKRHFLDAAHAEMPVEKLIGPWGNLEALRIPVANDDGTVADAHERLTPERWHFPGWSEQALSNLFSASDVSGSEQAALLDRSRWISESNSWVVVPPSSVIWSLVPSARSRIYAALAKSPLNYAQNCPFRFPSHRFLACLETCGMSRASRIKLQQLAYSDGLDTCFADLEAAHKELPRADFDHLVEALYQQPAYRLRLEITPATDVDALVRYWGKGGREKLIRPWLKSLGRVREGVTINVSTLLPPFARIRLNTYPAAWNDPTLVNEDCFYSALNFFNVVPNTNLLERACVEKTLATEYTEINGPPEYGDLLLLGDGSQRLFHCCVYIAGDCVFTKNGVNPSQPWVFMDIQDLFLTYYGRKPVQGVAILRRKDFMQQSNLLSQTVPPQPIDTTLTFPVRRGND